MIIEDPLKWKQDFQKVEVVAALFWAASGSKNRIPKKRLKIWGVTPCLQACGRSKFQPVIGGMPVVQVTALSLAAKTRVHVPTKSPVVVTFYRHYDPTTEYTYRYCLTSNIQHEYKPTSIKYWHLAPTQYGRMMPQTMSFKNNKLFSL